jgi:glycogen synthase
LDQKIAFATYETPYSPGGGISAVMAHLPHALQKVSSIDTYVISPFHRNIPKTIKLEPELTNFATFMVNFDGQEIPVDILRLDRRIHWIFLKPNDEGIQPPFFAAINHPYDVQRDPEELILLRDSLFLGKAIATSLTVLDPQAKWTMILQDWETATTCFNLTKKSKQNRLEVPFLILHNFYDSGISAADFQRIDIDPKDFKGTTVLQCALPFINDPVFTVSEQFAHDFSKEIMISDIMIPHLIKQLTPRLVGVNNGVFKELSVPQDAILSAQSKDFTKIRNWKIANREKAYKALDDLTDSIETPIWGDIVRFVRDDSPWFVMAGRDDPRQKGYEIASSAVEKFLSRGGTARFLFFPIPGDEGLPGIAFIKRLANQFPESVLCLPFLFRDGFFSVIGGSTYGIMPSYYEPFGMANEFYLSGTVCLGRATGGILQQLVPYREGNSFSAAVQTRSDRLRKAKTPVTGLLYRERDDIPSALTDWVEFNQAGYEFGNEFSRQKQRDKLILFQSMVAELTLCIQDGVEIYNQNKNLYYQMLINGISFIKENFDWDQSAKRYYGFIKA